MTDIQWSLLLIAVIVLMIVVQCNRAMADCYTPLTCLYGNDLGRSMEYERQRREMEDMQSRQRELESQLERQQQERRDREFENDLDEWRRGRPR